MAITKGKLSSLDKVVATVMSNGSKITNTLGELWQEFDASRTYWKGEDHNQFIKNGANKYCKEIDETRMYFMKLGSDLERIRQAYYKSVNKTPGGFMRAQGFTSMYNIKVDNEDDLFDNDRTKMKKLQTKTYNTFRKVKKYLEEIQTTIKTVKWEGEAATKVLPQCKKKISTLEKDMDKVYKNLKKNISEAIERKEIAEKKASQT